MSTPDSGVTAVLLQLQQLADRFGALEDREAEHHRDVSEAMTGLGGDIGKLRGTGVSQGKALVQLGQKLADLDAAVTSLLPPNPGPLYNPVPAVRWWDIADADRAKALTRLHGWVEQIYRPHYGHLAVKLADCWDQHLLCLIELDWASELWSVLYLRSTRDKGVLSSQAEYSTRILPALADQLHTETTGCPHQRPQVSGWGPR